jgi:hypothetical protein
LLEGFFSSCQDETTTVSVFVPCVHFTIYTPTPSFKPR